MSSNELCVCYSGAIFRLTQIVLCKCGKTSGRRSLTASNLAFQTETFIRNKEFIKFLGKIPRFRQKLA